MNLQRICLKNDSTQFLFQSPLAVEYYSQIRIKFEIHSIVNETIPIHLAKKQTLHGCLIEFRLI